jgi:hypothetical protein
MSYVYLDKYQNVKIIFRSFYYTAPRCAWDDAV